MTKTVFPDPALCAVVAAVLAFLSPSPAHSAGELRGHGGPVRAIAVSEDGETAITGSFDSAAIEWSLDAAAARRVLRFHDGQVTAVAALPEGGLATAGDDARIAVWGAEGGEPARVLTGHAAPVAGLALSPDGARLASASWDRTVRVWPLAGGSPLVLEGHRDNANAVAFLPDGRLVSAGYDARLILWPKEADGAPAAMTLPSPLNTLAALPDGRLVAGGADGSVRIVDIVRQAVLAEAAVAPTPVIALAVSPDGSRIAAAGLKGAIAVLDGKDLRLVHNLVGPGLPVWSLAFTPDGATLLTGGADRVVRRWDTATGAPSDSLASVPADPLAAYAGDPGAAVFRACVACHTLDADEGPRAGPTLAGIFGRRIGAAAGYHYSPALAGMDLVWTPEKVAELFTVGPAAYLPGTKMPEQRITSASDREALVRFLERATSAE